MIDIDPTFYRRILQWFFFIEARFLVETVVKPMQVYFGLKIKKLSIKPSLGSLVQNNSFIISSTNIHGFQYNILFQRQNKLIFNCRIIVYYKTFFLQITNKLKSTNGTQAYMSLYSLTLMLYSYYSIKIQNRYQVLYTYL